ncbi:hypothetical protein D6C82_08762 [Aureobasidium pullulans]|nr:hypothetical protein D6C82_08762 [Aureobasidium pullulans]
MQPTSRTPPSNMSLEFVEAELRDAFEHYRSRVIQLNRNNLAKLFEIVEVSPDSTEPEDLELVAVDEWYSLPDSINTLSDFYSLLSDGTEPPLPGDRRLQLLAEIEECLQDRVPSEWRPLSLPEDFKQLCVLTDGLTGPGLPKTNAMYIPHAFNGLGSPLASLKGNYLSAEEMKAEPFLDLLDYEVAVAIGMGDVAGGTGETWKWRWSVRLGHDQPPRVYEDVVNLLEKYWKDFLTNIIASYDDIGQDDL